MKRKHRSIIDGVTEDLIREHASAGSLSRGIELYNEGQVEVTKEEPGRLEASVKGSKDQPYLVIITWRKEDPVSETNISCSCTCPDKRQGYCKHTVAVLLGRMDVQHTSIFGVASAVVAASDPMKHQRWLSAAYGIPTDEEPKTVHQDEQEDQESEGKGEEAARHHEDSQAEKDAKLRETLEKYEKQRLIRILVDAARLYPAIVGLVEKANLDPITIEDD